MHFYSMSLNELMQLPISAFWELYKNVARIRASEDQRLFSAVANAMGGDAKEYMESLRDEQGKIVTQEDTSEFDKRGFEQLKNLIGAG